MSPLWKKGCLMLALLVGLDLVGVTLLAAGAYRTVRQYKPAGPVDAAIVFFGGEPDLKLLAVDVDKLDHAVRLLAEGKVRNVLCVGGSRPYTTRVGARMMRSNLLRRGLPPDRILADSTSFDSRSNWHSARTIAAERGWGSVVLLSRPLHLMRLLSESEGTPQLEVFATFSPSWDNPGISTATGLATATALWRYAHFEALAWTAAALLPPETYRRVLRYLRDRRLI